MIIYLIIVLITITIINSGIRTWDHMAVAALYLRFRKVKLYFCLATLLN